MYIGRPFGARDFKAIKRIRHIVYLYVFSRLWRKPTKQVYNRIQLADDRADFFDLYLIGYFLKHCTFPALVLKT